MKKYIFLALLTMGVSSCQLVDVLDQKPEFEADLDGAIKTPAAVELALNGIYYSLPGNGFNVIFPSKWFIQSRNHVASRNCKRR